MTESNPPFVGGQVPLELKEALEKAAKELDLSMAQILRRALAAFLVPPTTVEHNTTPTKATNETPHDQD